ncbi:MAG TPA: SDR family oxidoreductase [Gaiellaceae bacterium]|nr:SDR family oxidoreductase [Gaiellaceae bacterium]
MGQALDGRVIAVAGGAGNLGPTVVRRLAEEGSRACVCGRDRAGLDELSSEIAAPIETDVVDLLDPVATKAWAEHLAARHDGRVDGLVHLVGGWRGGTPIEEAPLEDWDWLSPLLVRTVQHATQALAPALMASGRGRFVIVSAGQAQAPTHSNASYAAAKAASETWTLALADRFKGTGATANIVVVGAIVTPQMRAESPDKDFSTFTSAEEIAEAIAYLCSDAASSMNGQRLTLRGAV